MAEKAPLKPLYLILSDQAYLRDQPLSILKARLEAEEGNLDFNFETFDGTTAEADDIIAAANTLPFAALHRLVIVQAVDKMKTDALKDLATYAQNPNPTTILVLVGEKLAKNTVLYKAVAANGNVMNRKTPKKNELPPIVLGMFGEAGLQTDQTTATALINVVGNDLEALRSAIQQVKTYAKEGARITRADVAAVVGDSAEVTVWEFSAALSDRKPQEALRVFRKVLNQGESMFFAISLAQRTVRDLMTARALIDRGQGNTAAVAAAIGKPDWLAGKLLRQAQRYQASELREALQGIAHVEDTLKTSQPQLGQLALERWILTTCAG
jgi:DNA polymerase-3 subunit delta